MQFLLIKPRGVHVHVLYMSAAEEKLQSWWPQRLQSVQWLLLALAMRQCPANMKVYSLLVSLVVLELSI